jgi:hypothetical protein
MNSTNRDLLVLLNDHTVSDEALEQQVESLHLIIGNTESSEQFCIAHELMVRNSISRSAKKILKAIAEPEFKPFWFLIGKN